MKNQRTILAIAVAAVVVVCVLAGLWAAVPGSAAEPPRRPGLTPCKEPGMPPDALCGTYEVFENRAARSGRKIPLQIVVLPAADPKRLPDPFVFFAGGPGESSISDGLATARLLGSLRQKRDVLLVDYRGTGRSGGLFCPELQGDAGVQGFLDDFLPLDKVRACRDRLKKEVDLSWYTTDTAVDDVEEVRAALGYGPLNLMGVSYGTRAALTYLRRHPESVRTVTLEGVMTPEERYPLGLARATQQALDGLIAECEGDPACHGAFPQMRQEVDAVLRRVAAEPVRVELTDLREPFEIHLGFRAVAQTLRYRLYTPAEAALLPLEVHLAAQGDWTPLARAARGYGRMFSAMTAGFYQSVTCAEDLAFLRDDEIGTAVAGTFLGDFRVRAQKAACEGWPTRALNADFHAPVVADVPALLISGERDPATPAAGGERVARTLKRSRHLVIADGGHGTDGMQGNCVLDLIAAFIEAGAAEGLDTSCIDRMRRPDFALASVSADGPEVLVARADLERLQGTYASQEMGFGVKVDFEGDRLRFSVTQGPPFRFLLIPIAPTRFRADGEGIAPGLVVAFQVTDGKATALSVLQPGKPEVVLSRTE